MSLKTKLSDTGTWFADHIRSCKKLVEIAQDKVPGLDPENWNLSWQIMGTIQSVCMGMLALLLLVDGQILLGVALFILMGASMCTTKWTRTWITRIPMWILLGPFWVLEDLLLTWAGAFCAQVMEEEIQARQNLSSTQVVVQDTQIEVSHELTRSQVQSVVCAFLKQLGLSQETIDKKALELGLLIK